VLAVPQATSIVIAQITIPDITQITIPDIHTYIHIVSSAQGDTSADGAPGYLALGCVGY
jgi:hypothetical protein